METKAPFLKDVLLVGGGHAHVQVLRAFIMRPEPGIRLTMVAREPHTPYSGMLPGYVAGQYTWDEIHFDLLKLCTAADCRFIADEITGINADLNVVQFANRPTLRYDVLSVNTGGVPGVKTPGIEHTIPVKPIGRFIPQWQEMIAEAKQRESFSLAIVGGGPGSVELAFAIREQFGDLFDIELVTADDSVLINQSIGAQKKATKELKKYARISVQCRVERIEKIGDNVVINIKNKDSKLFDGVLWVTGVEAPKWLQNTSLPLNAKGFMWVNDYLQSPNYANIFGAGDVVELQTEGRPKSGVYAVREGPPLSHNLRAYAIGGKLKPFRPQRHALALLRLSSDRVLATRRNYLGTNKIGCTWKHWIDKRFMVKFQELPHMREEQPTYAKTMDIEIPESMRCGGCGAKLGANVLERVLRRLGVFGSTVTESYIGDDAAVVHSPSDQLVLTIDGFRSMLSDPWMFGRICAHHALNDLYAMNAEPKTALALVTVPVMSDALMEEDLYQVMSGALDVFQHSGVQLVGGHSAEGMELSLGFALTGSLNGSPWLKGGMRDGDKLILTKAVGTGVLLAGAMQSKVPAREMCEAVEQMNVSNSTAAQILSEFDVGACTDVTGFGLVGHLSEMCRSSNLSATLRSSQVPILQGAWNAMATGIQSSLQDNNEQALADWEIDQDVEQLVTKLLVDPQTSGGLLVSIATNDTESCLLKLKDAGYTDAALVGEVTSANDPNQIIK